MFYSRGISGLNVYAKLCLGPAKIPGSSLYRSLVWQAKRNNGIEFSAARRIRLGMDTKVRLIKACKIG